jgi:hypothetical protein
VEELLTIRDLLYTQRFTIDGAKKQLYKMRGNGELEAENGEKQKLIRIKQELQQIRKMIC